jgi:hypothetical protein
MTFPVSDIALGQREGDSRIAFHTHGIGHDTMGTTQGNAQWAVGNVITTALSSGPAVYDNGWTLRSAPQGTPDVHPVTGVNFIVYTGKPTLDTNGDILTECGQGAEIAPVTTRMMIEARLAEAGIGEEEIKMLKEQLATLKESHAK